MIPLDYRPDFDLPPGIPGMLYDSGFTDKVTVPAGVATPFGIVVGVTPATGISVLPVGTAPKGVALHDHLLAGRSTTQDGYIVGDAISVIQRGRVWGRASGACTPEAVAKYDPATGIFADAGTATLAGARFLLADILVPAGALPSGAAQRIVLVELHNPTA